MTKINKSADSGLRLRDNAWFEAALVTAITAMFLLALWAAHLSWSYNSDELAIQGIVQSWLAGQPLDAVVGTDNFVIKLPLYLVVSLVPNSRTQVFITVAVCNLILLAGVIVFVRRLLRFSRRSGKMRLLLGYLPLAAWASLLLVLLDPGSDKLNRYGFGLYHNVNFRNAEIGIMLVIFVLLERLYLRRANGMPLARWGLLIVGALGFGLFLYSDPFYVYIGGSAIIVTALILYLTSRLSLPGLGLAVGFVVASVAAKAMIDKVLRTLGVDVVSIVPEDFVAAADLPRTFANGFAGVFTMYQGDFWGVPLSAPGVKFVLVNAGLAAGFPVALGWSIARLRRGRVLEIAVVSAVVINLAAYVFSVHGTGRINDRYLFNASVMMLPVMGQMLVSWFARFGTRRLSGLASLALVGIIVTNVGLNIVVAGQEARRPKAFDAQQQLIQVIRAEGVTKGYARFWDANPVRYFSNREVLALPVDCPQGKVVRAHWLVNRPDFDIPAERTFFIRDLGEKRCLIHEQFGPAAKTVPVGKDFVVYFYDRDVITGVPAYQYDTGGGPT